MHRRVIALVEELNQIAGRGVILRLREKLGREPDPSEISKELIKWRGLRPGAPFGDGDGEPVLEWRGLHVSRPN